MNRITEWLAFSSITQKHIGSYTIPQYGDAPDDNLQTWTIEDCLRAIDKYVKRNMRVNARGRKEALRDMVKIAHYAAVIFWKMYHIYKDTEMSEIYTKEIEEGR